MNQNDLISRSALLFVLGNEFFPAKGEFARAMDIARFSIQDATAIDAVEVVRCKDCKLTARTKSQPKILCWCNKFGNVMRPDDYCSFGERRADNAGQENY